MPKSTAQLIDGRGLADTILLDLRRQVALLNRPPGLAAILIGDDPSSAAYIRNKKKACYKVGINFSEYRCASAGHFPNITEAQILEAMDFLNNDPEIDGIIVQLPLPKQFHTDTIINHINPKKDVDGFLANKKAVLEDHEFVVTPPLIDAIWAALKSTDEPLAGKSTVLLSKNPIFSTPLAKALEGRGLNVTVLTPDDKKLTEMTQAADIVIVVLGKKYFLKKSMVKKDAIVVDVGSNLTETGEFVGDVDPGVKQVAKWITPVPGGVGPLTVAMLLKNTYELAVKNQ